MFDANLRHISAGCRVFVEVITLGKEHDLYKAGLRQDDIVICDMLDDDSENPRVNLLFNGRTITIKQWYDESTSYLIQYAGQLNGTDFLWPSVRDRAMKVLEAFKFAKERISG